MRRALSASVVVASTFVAMATLIPLAACGSSGDGSEFRNGSGAGDGGGADGGNAFVDGAVFLVDGSTISDGHAGDGPCGPNLLGTLRDFKDTHPDFEKFLGDDRGIVAVDLGADLKPVYASQTTTPTTTGKSDFDQWYRNVPGINIAVPFELKLTKGANGIFTFDDATFFPLDNQGWGNEGRSHNFHFTYELHTEFKYGGGEVFTFIGDDDVFVFINGKLAIDLGGVHSAETQSVNLDQKAGALGIQKGTTYPLAIFQAERHTTESHFRVDTTITFTNCTPIVP